jgi:hypothetical protein
MAASQGSTWADDLCSLTITIRTAPKTTRVRSCQRGGGDFRRRLPEENVMEEAAQALLADLNQLLEDGLVLPLSVVAMDAQGHCYGGVYGLDSQGGRGFRSTVDTLGKSGMGLPHYYLIVDALGQAAVREVTYQGQEDETSRAQGSPIGRLRSRLHRIT